MVTLTYFTARRPIGSQGPESRPHTTYATGHMQDIGDKQALFETGCGTNVDRFAAGARGAQGGRVINTDENTALRGHRDQSFLLGIGPVYVLNETRAYGQRTNEVSRTPLYKTREDEPMS